MRSLAEQEDRLKAELEWLEKARKVACSIEGMSMMNQMYIDFIYAMDIVISRRSVIVWEGVDIKFEKGKPVLRILTPYLPYRASFNKIGHLINEMQDTEVAVYRYEVTHELDGVKFSIGDYITTELPEEYIKLLIGIGKIREEVVPSRIDRALSCGDL
jgi:hypothetical protein